MTLDQPTPETLRARDDALRDAERHQAEETRKALADDLRAGFILTGSDRETDQLTARGQTALDL